MQGKRFCLFLVFVFCINILLLCLQTITQIDFINYKTNHPVRPSLLENYREAIVTLVTGDVYVPGALVLGYTLNKYNAGKSGHRHMIALIKRDSISDFQHLKMLEQIGWKLIYVESIPFPGFVTSRLSDGLIKLNAWNMTQYNTILVLDADVMIIGSIEEPFNLMKRNEDIPLLAVNYPFPANTSANKTYLNSYFNAGVLFLRPNVDYYKELIRASSIKGSYHLKFPQQNLLNTYFLGKWLSLPIIYNYNHRNPIWNTEKNNTRIVHFAGMEKPWSKVNQTTYKNKHETDYLWQKFFINMSLEYGWKEQDFLSQNASKQLQLDFDFQRIAASAMY